MIIDFHAHVFPDALGEAASLLPESPAKDAVLASVGLARKKARSWMRAYAGTLHHVQTLVRHLPDPIRRPLDELSGIAPLPSLLVESTPADLAEAMAENSIGHAVVIAHPPFATTEWLLECCASRPELTVAANVPAGTSKPGDRLKELAAGGARLLKIHPAADGEGVDSPRYRALLKAADGLGLPVVLHTGCLHSHVLYRDPSQGQAQRFSPWFREFGGVRFVLSHMNFHQPHVALDLAEEHENLWVDTSWQPAEMIGEAVRRIGDRRVLFATDWPFVGQNHSIGVRRVRECVEAGTLTQEGSARVLGENAAGLLRLDAASAQTV